MPPPSFAAGVVLPVTTTPSSVRFSLAMQMPPPSRGAGRAPPVLPLPPVTVSPEIVTLMTAGAVLDVEDAADAAAADGQRGRARAR